jgi:hypothetical protein
VEKVDVGVGGGGGGAPPPPPNPWGGGEEPATNPHINLFPGYDAGSS